MEKSLKGRISRLEADDLKGAYQGRKAQKVILIEGENIPRSTVGNGYARSDGEERYCQGDGVDNQQLAAAVGGGDDGVGSRKGPVAGGRHGRMVSRGVAMGGVDGTMVVVGLAWLRCAGDGRRGAEERMSDRRREVDRLGVTRGGRSRGGTRAQAGARKGTSHGRTAGARGSKRAQMLIARPRRTGRGSADGGAGFFGFLPFCLSAASQVCAFGPGCVASFVSSLDLAGWKFQAPPARKTRPSADDYPWPTVSVP